MEHVFVLELSSSRGCPFKEAIREWIPSIQGLLYGVALPYGL
jgi:hypothetical protein